MKYLQFRMDNGEVWIVPTHIIAKSRATYYAEEDPDTTYQEEYDFTMTDKHECADWAQNNMDWDDLKPYARRIKNGVEPDYQELFVNAETEFREEAL